MAEIVVKQHAEDVNLIRFTGVITSIREGEKASNVYFRTETKNRSRRFHTNVPSLCVFDKDVLEKAKKFANREHVTVTGHITSSKSPRFNANGSRYALQSFVMTDIEPAKEGEPDENYIEIIGSVERAYKNRGDSVSLIIVSFREEKYMKRIKVEGYDVNHVDYLDFMGAGTRVHITGHCSTRHVETETGARYYEYIVADTIEKV